MYRLTTYTHLVYIIRVRIVGRRGAGGEVLIRGIPLTGSETEDELRGYFDTIAEAVEYVIRDGFIL